MFILEVEQQIELDTPKGRGRLLYITEFGMEIEKLFTVALSENGQIWEFTNRDIRAVKNITFGRNIKPKNNSSIHRNSTLNSNEQEWQEQIKKAQ